MILDRFVMNGYLWKVELVDQNDPRLVDRTGRWTVATTDPAKLTVCLDHQLSGDFLMTVFIHELGHCTLWSYDILPEIHRMTYPECWVEMEELICNIIADYGRRIYEIGYQKMGYRAWKLIPEYFEKKYKEDQNG